MTEEYLVLEEFKIAITRKNIKNINLHVAHPSAEVKVNAPYFSPLPNIHDFVLSKLDWIRKSQEKIKQQQPSSQSLYLDGETHYVWGKAYLLKIIEKNDLPRVILEEHQLSLFVRPGSNLKHKERILQHWYKQQMKSLTQELVAKWSIPMQVRATKIEFKTMRSRWGRCSPHSGELCFNIELAKKPPICLEYIVVHELAHLLEPSHNHRFKSIMNKFMPKWQEYKALLK